MPQLVRTEHVPGIYDEKSKNLGGVPMDYYVRPVVRQGGLGQDIPKGMELPSCMVDQCCESDPVEGFPLSMSRTVHELRDCSATTVNFTITLTNIGATDLTNLTMTPISLAFPGWVILSGDTELVMPPTPVLAAGASITLLATTNYEGPASTVDYVFEIPPGVISSDQGVNDTVLGGTLMQLCPPV